MGIQEQRYKKKSVIVGQWDGVSGTNNNHDWD